MKVDTSTPEGLVRTIVVPNNVPYITRFVTIRKDEYVCDQDVGLYAPVKYLFIYVKTFSDNLML